MCFFKKERIDDVGRRKHLYCNLHRNGMKVCPQVFISRASLLWIDLLRLLLHIMTDSSEGRLNQLDVRLEKLLLLCRERELHLSELVKNHRAVVRWNGFASDSFTKDENQIGTAHAYLQRTCAERQSLGHHGRSSRRWPAYHERPRRR